MLIDNEQRQQATDPQHSFIVQAPAGSGKTELLSQRYLRLLGIVNAPEQIVALTFTRKAASEMRERIIHALQQADQNLAPRTEHQKQTLKYAQNALKQSKKYGWNILHHANRLKIITIDSLCQSINQSIPLLERHMMYSTINDNSESLYIQASKACLRYALQNKPYQHAIKTLLLHIDNRQEQLLGLFTSMLSKRDQWLNPLFYAKNQQQGYFEEALSRIEAHELARFHHSLPADLAEQLTQLAREVSCIENNPQSPRYALKDWTTFHTSERHIIFALSKLLLTGDDAFRKSFDHHVGLSSSICSASEYKRIKEHSKRLLTSLNDYPDFYHALIQVRQLPNPKYDPEQWEVLNALFELLPLLLGHLNLLFQERNEVDFVEVAQQALHALGEDENPTDLALYLDNTIHHLLVDEFQDTSINQFELLKKLTCGWQDNQGKTLFIVGDPMQSIYRFRQAEVGLFFRAQIEGISGIHLNALQLSCNFRATPTIISWVNTHFAGLFPKTKDIESGAVPFHPSAAVKPDTAQTGVYAFEFTDKIHQAQYLTQLIREQLQQHPDQSMAILVRSRTQLIEIIQLLRIERINYQGTDINRLSNLLHIRDALSLTQALLFPANRLAWLCLLRSPYVGISLADVLIIAEYNAKKSIFDALVQLSTLTILSDEGQIRCAAFLSIMQKAYDDRYHYRLSTWINRTLQSLYYDHILNANELSELEQFWHLLERYDQAGRIVSMNDFMRDYEALYSQEASPARLQIMTIHKSKGLEFDTVFLPGLSAKINSNEKPLLRWIKLPTEHDDSLLLMSPIHAAHQHQCLLYNYLGTIDDTKTHYESQRLLYVAVTRARERLYLLDSSIRKHSHSFRSLLKNQEFQSEVVSSDILESENFSPIMQHLPLDYYQSLPAQHPIQPAAINKVGALQANTQRIIGIVTHQLLQWICSIHPQKMEQIPWSLAKHTLKQYGFHDQQQIEIMDNLQHQIARFFADPKGRWIMSKHDNEHSELEILVNYKGQMVTRIIDRVFEYNKQLWIVDFKTGREDQHRLTQDIQQLNDYALFMQNTTNIPIYCGLYYLDSNHWTEWPYSSVVSVLD